MGYFKHHTNKKRWDISSKLPYPLEKKPRLLKISCGTETEKKHKIHRKTWYMLFYVQGVLLQMSNKNLDYSKLIKERKQHILHSFHRKMWFVVPCVRGST